MMLRSIRISAIPVFVIAGVAPVFAQVDNPAWSQSIGWAIVKTIAALFFILGLFFVLVYLAKKYYPKAFGGSVEAKAQGDGIDILTVRPLGGKRFLYLVKAGKRRVLIGMTESNMQPLTEWEEEEEEKSQE